MAKESQNKDLAWIKKHYGEKMAHLCRELFPTILETKGLLPKLLSEHFAQSRSLAEDIQEQCKENEFKSFLFSLIDVENNNKIIKTESPERLMSKVGYILFPECKTEEDIQSFRHYYDRGEPTPKYKKGRKPLSWKGEELCTFNGGRLKSCRVWFAVKKEVIEDEKTIKRFKNPQRQDEYGTSVISIQFSKGKNSTLSIKNRYNHRVNNPDATFGNNLDNIVEGLTEAFCQTYSISIKNIKNEFDLNGYVKAKDGKYYRYNYEINNIYYCDNNIIINNFEVNKLENRFILTDYYIFDLSKNKVKLYDINIQDCFCTTFGKIDKISLEKDEDKNTIIRVKAKNKKDILVTLDKNRKIIKLDNPNVEKCGSGFMCYNNSLIKLSLQNLAQCGDNFMYDNNTLIEILTPNLRKCGSWFMKQNNTLKKLYLPNLIECGKWFMKDSNSLISFFAPNLEGVCDKFLYSNQVLDEFFAPKLKYGGYLYLPNNAKIRNQISDTIEANNIKKIMFDKSLYQDYNLYL